MEGHLTLLKKRLRGRHPSRQTLQVLPPEDDNHYLPCAARTPRGSSAPAAFRPKTEGNPLSSPLVGSVGNASHAQTAASDRFQPRRVTSPAPRTVQRRQRSNSSSTSHVAASTPRPPSTDSGSQPQFAATSARPPLPVRRSAAGRCDSSKPLSASPSNNMYDSDASPPSGHGNLRLAATTTGVVPALPAGMPKFASMGGQQLPAILISAILRYLPVASVPTYRRICYCCHAVTQTRLSRDPVLKSAVDLLLEGRRLKSKRVWVIVRARPAGDTISCINIDRNRVAVKGAASVADSAFFFDRAFGEAATQAEVGEYVCGNVLPHAMNGEHICLLAYGQTGSGKTHTMFGDLQPGVNQGVAFLAVSRIAEQLRSRKASGVAVEFSFMEVYNDEVYDLLDGQKRLPKQRSSDKHVVPQGLSRRRCELDEMEKQVHCWLKEGAATRTIGKTVFNPRSSRSHGIVLLNVLWGNSGSAQASRIRSLPGAESSKETRIYIVDLAGSERAGMYAMEKEQLKEGEHINLSLSALGRVVSALAAGRCEHVPYRDSALTWLLKDAITGTSARVCMLAALHPAHSSETAITLRYAKQYSSLQASTNTQIPQLTQEVQKQQRIVDNLKRHLEQVMAGDEHGIPWTWETIEGTVQPTRNARELVEGHPHLVWTQAHQSKHIIRGNRRDRGAIGRIRNTKDVVEPRGANETPDGRPIVGSLDFDAISDEMVLDKVAEVIFEGKNGRPSVVLWYPETALESVQPPKKLLDAIDKLKHAEELLTSKRSDLSKAKEERSKEQRAWMAKDG
eukprot:TRINITY_DN23009_c0_g1_i1.p1 TRINITY_DN23009_c0_g1~~TRINITY_DN23009_c0_g1_i1.p1  ORF type:complete len:792 (-),score=110.50 TRINITY_DN23009_c0_g1_i1:110-2485(-)